MVGGLWRGLRWLQGQIEEWSAPERSRVQIVSELWRLPSVSKPKVRYMNLTIVRAEASGAPQRRSA